MVWTKTYASKPALGGSSCSGLSVPDFPELRFHRTRIFSMSKAAYPYDNALMERYYNTLKNELKQQFPFKNFKEAERKIFQYIEVFYNRERIHSALNYITPQEYEDNYYKK